MCALPESDPKTGTVRRLGERPLEDYEPYVVVPLAGAAADRQPR